MINMPKDVSVILTFKEFDGKIHRTNKMTQGFIIAKACIFFRESKRDFRIYPIASKTKYNKVPTELAWNEGMTLPEFEDYLND